MRWTAIGCRTSTTFKSIKLIVKAQLIASQISLLEENRRIQLSRLKARAAAQTSGTICSSNLLAREGDPKTRVTSPISWNMKKSKRQNQNNRSTECQEPNFATSKHAANLSKRHSTETAQPGLTSSWWAGRTCTQTQLQLCAMWHAVNTTAYQ